jgi:hypothetical protein
LVQRAYQPVSKHKFSSILVKPRFKVHCHRAHFTRFCGNDKAVRHLVFIIYVIMLFSNFGLENAIKKVQGKAEELELKETQLPVCTDHVKILGET